MLSPAPSQLPLPTPEFALHSRERLPLHGPDPLTTQQWKTLLAIADAIFPSVQPAGISAAGEDNDTNCVLPAEQYQQVRATIRNHLDQARIGDIEREGMIDHYLAEKPSQIPEVREAVWTFFAHQAPAKKVAEIQMLLNMLDTRLGSVVLCGKTTPFSQLSYAQRRDVITSWNSARLPMFRKLATSLKLLFSMSYFTSSRYLPELIGAPMKPVHGEYTPGFDFVFNTPATASHLDADVVIVGSGCGGAVAAANLSAAGLRVIVVEKGHCWKHEDFPLLGRYGTAQLFEGGGVMMSEEGNCAMLAGSNWGGGGTVNWSASFRTPALVRAEWAHNSGVPWFESAAFQGSLDRVCDRMGVSADHINHSHTNRVLLDGARKLGWSHRAVPQNTGGQTHYCGSCSFGCHSGGKNGTLESFLPDAARNGATFIQGFTVDQVMFDKKNGKVATGIKGTWQPRHADPDSVGEPMQITARRVIISAGSLQSPLVLMRSGVKNKHVGKHLKLHPVTLINAFFDYETRPWEGSVLTSVASEFDDQDGQGHGVKLEGVNIMPELYLQSFPWLRDPNPGLFLKEAAIKSRHMGSWIALSRDVGEGHVFADPSDGKLRISYPIHPADLKHMTKGVMEMVKLLHVSGARQIFIPLNGSAVWTRQGEIPVHSQMSDEMRLKPYPEPVNARKPTSDAETTTSSSDGSSTGPVPSQQVLARSQHYEPPADTTGEDYLSDQTLHDFMSDLRTRMAKSDGELVYMSAHQMGTCRMSARSGDGVVDGAGKVWGYKNLLVMDASVFPSASGVNPMVSVMAISDLLSRRLAAELKAEPMSRPRI